MGVLDKEFYASIEGSEYNYSETCCQNIFKVGWEGFKLLAINFIKKIYFREFLKNFAHPINATLYGRKSFSISV